MSAARSYALLGARLAQPSAVLAVGADGSRTVAMLWQDVGRLAARLPEAPDGRASEALIACGDRYAFAVALLASWARGYCAALPPSHHAHALGELAARAALVVHDGETENGRSEEHTSELQSHLCISYAVFCLDRKSVV